MGRARQFVDFEKVLRTNKYGAGRKWKPFKRDKTTSHDFAASSAASRPKELALAKKLVRSTCSKFRQFVSRFLYSLF